MIRRHTWLSVFGLFMVSLPTAVAPATQDGVSITFLANEGVMMSEGGRTVLIDGLFSHYKSYPIAPDSTRQALDRARAPFDAVNLILVTHRHGDHFHPASVAAHMQANPGALLVTSQQVIDSLRKYPPAQAIASSRLLPRTTAPGVRRRVSRCVWSARHHANGTTGSRECCRDERRRIDR